MNEKENKYLIGAFTDIGVDRELQEDFMEFKELDENNLLCVIADGTGSRPQIPQPATIVTMHITEEINEIFQENKEIFLNNPEFFLKRAMINANKLLGAFKMGNEELYSGYASSVTCCLATENNKISVTHCGNTRLYIMRNGRIKQLTKDHTRAAELLDKGDIDLETYYVHPSRLTITSGLGIVINPKIITFTCSLKENDIIIMTTDGVHYAIQSEPIADIVINSETPQDASRNLVDAAKNIIKYPDNMTAMIICKNQT